MRLTIFLIVFFSLFTRAYAGDAWIVEDRSLEVKVGTKIYAALILQSQNGVKEIGIARVVDGTGTCFDNGYDYSSSSTLIYIDKQAVKSSKRCIDIKKDRIIFEYLIESQSGMNFLFDRLTSKTEHVFVELDREIFKMPTKNFLEAWNSISDNAL